MVEEDWELVLAIPDANSSAPQITTTMSPLSHTDGVHMAFEVNHATQPAFHPGGLQLQVWNGEFIAASRNHSDAGTLSQAGETVRWTQRMILGDESILFEIDHGTSVEWGNFGGQGLLQVVVPTSHSNLNAYSPSVSTEHSGIGYAANRVQSMVLKEVRLYSATGLAATDSTDRVVHQLPD